MKKENNVRQTVLDDSNGIRSTGILGFGLKVPFFEKWCTSDVQQSSHTVSLFSTRDPIEHTRSHPGTGQELGIVTV